MGAENDREWEWDRDEEDGGEDTADALHAAVQEERHRAAARRYFSEAPLYRIEHEDDGSFSVSRKHYSYWPERPPAAATIWRAISRHRDLEEAERRLRHVTSPHIYYDERGRLAQAPVADGGAGAEPRNPWRD